VSLRTRIKKLVARLDAQGAPRKRQLRRRPRKLVVPKTRHAGNAAAIERERLRRSGKQKRMPVVNGELSAYVKNRGVVQLKRERLSGQNDTDKERSGRSGRLLTPRPRLGVLQGRSGGGRINPSNLIVMRIVRIGTTRSTDEGVRQGVLVGRLRAAARSAAQGAARRGHIRTSIHAASLAMIARSHGPTPGPHRG
jgi:hypothetical protein